MSVFENKIFIEVYTAAIARGCMAIVAQASAKRAVEDLRDAVRELS